MELTVKNIFEKFGDKYYSHCEKSAQRYLQNVLLEIKGNYLKITSKGLLLSDTIMRDLMF